MAGNSSSMLTRLFLKSPISTAVALVRGLTVGTAHSVEQLKEVYEFRYQVYLGEGYIPQNSTGEFRDKYDKNCVNIFVRDTRMGQIVATTRLIFNSNEGFPTERLFNISKVAKKVDSVAEISRFAIKKEYRGGKGVVFLLMVKQVYLELKKRDIEYVYSNMPEKLASHFSKFGFRFDLLEEGSPTEENIKERDLIGGYFNQKILLPYGLSISKAEQNIGIKK